MAQSGEELVKGDTDLTKRSSFNSNSEDAFHATPIVQPNSPQIDKTAPKTDPTFIQNQISIQRSPSKAKEQASVLSRQLSAKNGTNPSGLATTIEDGLKEDLTRGRGNGETDLCVREDTTRCTLQKSGSDRSNKSVRSLHVVGSHPLGSLRVHSPSPVRKPQVASHECLKSGDVVVIRDVPAGSLMGYDTRALVIGKDEQFDGIKNLPPGAHFIWGGSNSASLRNGFWIMSAKRASDEYGEVQVRRWDKYTEVLDEEVSAAEVRIQKDEVAEIFDKLHSYDLSTSKQKSAPLQLAPSTNTMVPGALVRDPNIWLHLTSCMKGALLSKITGRPWNEWQVSSTHDYKKPPRVGISVKDDSLDFRQDEILDFVFPKDLRTFSSSSYGRERTEQAMDTSSHVMAVITGNCTFEDSDEVIGELQFCFITGMLLGNVACMEQWAHVMKVVFKAFRLAIDYPKFFRKLIEAVHAQFIYDEEGLEGSILDHDPHLSHELRILLTTFKSRLNEQLLAQRNNLTPEQSDVGKAFEELESWLWKWGWDLRGNYVRSGKIQLEDGEFVDAEMKEFEAEDERGNVKDKRRSRHDSKSGSKSGGVRWMF